MKNETHITILNCGNEPILLSDIRLKGCESIEILSTKRGMKILKKLGQWK